MRQGYWQVLYSIATLYCSYFNVTMIEIDDDGIVFDGPSGRDFAYWRDVDSYMNKGKGKYPNLPNVR